MTYDGARSSCLARGFLVQDLDYQTWSIPTVVITFPDVPASVSWSLHCYSNMSAVDQLKQQNAALQCKLVR
jgi:hypothetical protein